MPSGLPDGSREADERAEARHLVDLLTRVKIAREIDSRMSSLGAMICQLPDWAAPFYARFTITERQFLLAVPSEGVADPTCEAG
jgi:hypothetical protein